jgi:hypothetical protein
MNLINDILLTCFIAFCSSCFSYFLDYALGKPGSEFVDDVNEKAILFFWPLFLAKRRAKIKDHCVAGITNKDFFGIGRDLFSWEYAVGMCIFCSNFWISEILFAIPIVFFNLVSFNIFSVYFLFLTIPVISHFILRKI